MDFYSLISNIILEIKKEIPSFTIKNKSKSIFMKMLSIFLFFNKKFMNGYVTTIGNTIYMTNDICEAIGKKEATFVQQFNYIIVLLHEYQHMKDSNKFKFLYYISYLFPQILAMLGFLYYPFFLFLLPLPSFRAYWEYRAYKVGIAVMYWLTGYQMDTNYIVKNFTSSSYYFMFPFGSYLKRKFDKEYRKIVIKELDIDLFLVNNILKRANIELIPKEYQMERNIQIIP